MSLPSFGAGLLRIIFDGAGRPTGTKHLIAELHQRPRGAEMALDGSLYVIMDEEQGAGLRFAAAD